MSTFKRPQNDQELSALLDNPNLSPFQKMEIVEAYQRSQRVLQLWSSCSQGIKSLLSRLFNNSVVREAKS